MANPTHRYARSLMQIGESGEARMREALRYVLVGGRSLAYFYDVQVHDIAYSVEACCFELGQPVGEIDSRDVERVEERLGITLFPDVTECWPLPIPPVKDFPLVGILSVAQIAERADALRAIEGAARNMFDGAASTGLEAIVFFH